MTAITDTHSQVIRNGTNGGTINAAAETVEFVIDTPQVARNYTFFEFGACQSGANQTTDALRMWPSTRHNWTDT